MTQCLQLSLMHHTKQLTSSSSSLQNPRLTSRRSGPKLKIRLGTQILMVLYFKSTCHKPGMVGEARNLQDLFGLYLIVPLSLKQEVNHQGIILLWSDGHLNTHLSQASTSIPAFYFKASQSRTHLHKTNGKNFWLIAPKMVLHLFHVKYIHLRYFKFHLPLPPD